MRRSAPTSPYRTPSGLRASPNGSASRVEPDNGEASDRALARPGPVKSADRVLLLLEYLAQVGEATFASIASDLELPSSSTHQLLQTALNRGFIELEESTRKFHLGFRLWEIAQSYPLAGNLLSFVQRLMDELVSTTTETVQLARLDGLDNVYLAISESPHPIKLVSSVGSRLPAHTTGLGKALLAGLPDTVLEELLDGAVLAAYTTRTITDVTVLRRELQRIRVRGYAEDNGEYVVGCRCIAMPIHNAAGKTVAAMSVSFPTPRYNKRVADNARAALAATIERLEQQMGVVR